MCLGELFIKMCKMMDCMCAYPVWSTLSLCIFVVKQNMRASNTWLSYSCSHPHLCLWILISAETWFPPAQKITNRSMLGWCVAHVHVQYTGDWCMHVIRPAFWITGLYRRWEGYDNESKNTFSFLIMGTMTFREAALEIQWDLRIIWASCLGVFQVRCWCTLRAEAG